MMFVLFGLVVGILSSGSGLGGGLLAVPLLIYLGKEAKMAVGTSFLFIVFVAISSLVSHWRLGNVDIRTGLLLAAGGVVGAKFGPLILDYVSHQNFKRGFAVFLLAISVWLLWNSKG